MAMVNESTYTYLLSWLCPAMEAEYKRLYSKGKDGGKLRGLGKYDKNVYQGRVDRLRAIVRNLICEAYRKACRHYGVGGNCHKQSHAERIYGYYFAVDIACTPDCGCARMRRWDKEHKL